MIPQWPYKWLDGILSTTDFIATYGYIPIDVAWGGKKIKVRDVS